MMLIVILNFYNSDIKIFCGNFQTSYLKLLKCEIILELTSDSFLAKIKTINLVQHLLKPRKQVFS